MWAALAARAPAESLLMLFAAARGPNAALRQTAHQDEWQACGQEQQQQRKKEDQTQQYSLCPEAKTGGEVSRGDGLSVLLTIRDIVGWEQRGEAQQGGWVNDTLDAWVCGSYTVL